MKSRFWRLGAASTLAVVTLLAGCERPPVDSVQRGYRGTAMGGVYNPRTVAVMTAANQAPPASTAVPADGPRASEVYKNVQVLGDLSVAEFVRTMAAITEWVAPEQGCTYCHAGGNFEADNIYTKVVARKMLQMTKTVNASWTSHVAATGVTCYTCHRGKPVPENIWFTDSGPTARSDHTGGRAGQNAPAAAPLLASLPVDPFTPFLKNANEIRVIGTTALPTGNRQSTKQAEWTYSLMNHMSGALGVNCTYCHNSQSFGSWETSTPQRVTAWHGIRMVRAINNTYLEPLTATFPAERLGPEGDVAKANCATCHQGAYKPLYGAAMARDYPALMAAPKAAIAAQAGAARQVLFGSGRAALDAKALREISEAAKSLQGRADAKLVLSGFADQSGNAEKNLELAKVRAFAVRDALKAAGIAEDRIELKKPEFVVGGSSDNSRRVEIVAR
jgi:photosynthetic reaction center cytochrome c subunit